MRQHRLWLTSGVFFATPNLSYLRRGGRISHLQAILASALRLTPILGATGGPLRVNDHVHGENKVMAHLINLTAERLGKSRPVRIAVVHADAEAAAWQLSKEAGTTLNPDELFTSELTPVIGVHAGPGAVGLAYSSGA